MACGAVTGQPGKGLLLELALKSGRHAFLGLFGGGPRLISSSVQIHTLWPVTEIKIDTERTGLGSLGLLIHALTAFATKQGIGGWARNGFGRFEAQFDLVTADNVRVPLLTKTDAGYEPNVDAEEVAEALDAWATVSATINAAELKDL